MYSIKTDLGVSGNGTINKDLLVKGNAVINGDLQVDGTVDFANATFTQITVTGTANLADITSTGTASLKDVAVSGNTVLGDASTDTVTVNGTSTFAAPATFNGNVSQTAGTASFKATSLDSLTVAGVSQLNGNLDMGAGTKATMKDLETDTLKVNGASILGGTLNVTGKTTLGDVEINGTLSGSYTMDSGNFNTITVAQLSDLNNVNIKGATTLTGNITGANSTISVKRLNMQGSDAIVEFAYNDPSRPNDTKSSIEPYQVSTQTVVSKKVNSNAADIGVIGGSEGLHAIGKATIDYLNITGNSTIGDQNQLQVAGKSVFTGKTTVGDLEITGSVTGLSFSDLNVTTLTVTGNSALQGGVSVGGNLTGASASIAKFSTFTVADGTAGNHGIIQFEYADSGRPSDIKSSVEPYKVSSQDIVAGKVTTLDATVGNVGGTAGLSALGKSTMDYVHIKGNSTIGTAQPQLQVDGKSILGDVDFTGTVTGLVVDISGQDITPKSVVAEFGVTGQTLSSTAGATIGSDLSVTNGITAKSITLSDATATNTVAGNVTVNGQTVTVKDLVVTGTTTGVTAEADVDGLDIAPNKVDVTTTLGVTGKSTLGEVTAGASTLASLSVTGASTLAGVTAGATTLNSATVTTTLGVTGATTLAGVTASTLTVPSVTGNTTFANDLTVTGQFKPEGGLDLSAVDVAAKSLTTTAGANIGGNLVVTGTVDLSASDVTVKSLVTPGVVTSSDSTNPSTLPVLNSTTATITNVNAGDVDATGDISATNVAASADVSAATVTSPKIQGAAAGAGTVTLESNTVAAKDLTVTGVFKPEGGLDLSAVDITSKSITTTEGATIGGDLSVAGTVDLSGADVTALSFVSSDALKTNTFPKLASDGANIGALTVTGNSILSAVTASNVNASGTLGVTGATTLAGVTAGAISATSVTTSAAVSAASFTSAAATISLAKNTQVTGNLHATGTLTAGTIDLSATDVTVKSLESLGNAHIVGDLTVDGVFDLSATNLTAASLASTGATTVGTNLVLTTGNITGSPKVSGTLNVTGATTLAGLTAGVSGLGNTTVTGTLGVSGATTLGQLTASSASVTGTATLGNLAVPTGNSSLGGNLIVSGDTTVEKLTVNGQLIPTGGIDLSGADISANSLATAAGATVGTTLGVTGNTTVGGTLGVTGATTLAGLTAGASTLASVTATGAGKFGSVTSDNGLIATTGDLIVTAGNIAQNGAATATASFKKTSTTNLHVGTLVWDEVEYIAEIGGNAHISGDLDVDGTINAQINLTGRDISPRAVNASTSITVGTTLTVSGQSTMASAIIGAPDSVNNNLQINGNTTCTGNFTVQGLIIGTLDQSTSDVVAKSVTATTFVKGATLESTGNATIGGTTTAAGKVTISAGGLAVTGGTSTDTLTTTGIATVGGKLTISAGGLAVTGGTTTDTLTVTGTTNLGAVTAGAVTATTLTVSGTSGFTGKVTAVDLDSTGTITANNLTVTGTFDANIADLATDSITTKKYEVLAAASETVAGGTTWTPDGTSNVYNLTFTGTGQVTMGKMPITVGKAASWFIYITQSATPVTVDWGTDQGLIGDSAVGTNANGVSICQLVYCGVGTKIDVFIAQRNL